MSRHINHEPRIKATPFDQIGSRFHRPNTTTQDEVRTGVLPEKEARLVYFTSSGKTGEKKNTYHMHAWALSIPQAEKILRTRNVLDMDEHVLEIQGAGKDGRSVPGHFIRYGIPEAQPPAQSKRKKPQQRSALAILESENAKRREKRT